MKDKIEKYLLKRKNRIQKAIEAFELYLTAVGMFLTIGAIATGNFWTITGIYALVFLFIIGQLGMDKLMEEWKEAKEKDEDENNKKDYGHFYMNGKDEDNENNV